MDGIVGQLQEKRATAPGLLLEEGLGSSRTRWLPWLTLFLNPHIHWHRKSNPVNLLRYCARPPFALERLSVIRGPNSRITRIRYVLPRHKAATCVGPGRQRESTPPGASGIVELSPLEFLDRLADLIPRPRKHRHRYQGVFAPNHPLRPAVTALAVGNVGK